MSFSQIYNDVAQKHYTQSVAQLQEVCHGLASEAGWWDSRNLDDPQTIPACLCLVHSEVSEAMEGARKNRMDDHLPHRKALEVELADAMIRILDMGAGLGLDVGGAMQEKIEYNKHRADHQIESRKLATGKKY